MPTYCSCGEKNSVYHALDCKLGGYVSMRHDSIRDTLAYFLREAKCKDVRVEPPLMPVNATLFKHMSNTQDEARLDISAVGVYAPFEKTFMDVRVTHPNCKSNVFKPLAQVYAEHEKAKKDAYEERVRESEKGSFIPLIFTTSGGMGQMTSVLVKRLSEKISDSSSEARSMVTNYIRTKIRFAILRSTLIALRGTRGKGKTMYDNIKMDNISLNIIPNSKTYEVP